VCLNFDDYFILCCFFSSSKGPNDKKGLPVFYIIMARLDASALRNINVLIAYVFKTMNSVVTHSKYSLLVDYSW
jgi:hypothetical protein